MDHVKQASLTLCFLLKDEGESIARVIQAFHRDDGSPIYDELVVFIDDATTDDTLDKVRPFHPDHLEFFTWQNNFSAARNLAIRRCTREWIFFPDGHELLRPESRTVVELILSENDPDIWSVAPMLELNVDEFDIPELIFYRPMFFRNHKDIQFKKAIHNYLDCPAEHRRSVPEIRLVHNMPETRRAIREPQRYEMNTIGLEKAIENDPEDIRDTFYLANTYLDAEEFEPAIKYYHKTLELMNQREKPNRDWMAQIYVSLCLCYHNTQEWRKLEETAALMIRFRPDRAEGYFFLGLAYESLELPLRYAEKMYLITAGTPVPYDSAFFLFPKYYTWYPWDTLTQLYLKQGQIEKALQAQLTVQSYKKGCPITQENVRRLAEEVKKSKIENDFQMSLSLKESPSDRKE